MSNLKVLPHLIYNRRACYLRFFKDSLSLLIEFCWLHMVRKVDKQTERWMDGLKRIDRRADGRAEKQTDGQADKRPFIDTPNCMKFKLSHQTVKRATMPSYRYIYISIRLTSAVSHDDWFCWLWVVSRTCLAVTLSNHWDHLLVRWNLYWLKNRSWRLVPEEIKKFRCGIREETQKK